MLTESQTATALVEAMPWTASARAGASFVESGAVKESAAGLVWAAASERVAGLVPFAEIVPVARAVSAALATVAGPTPRSPKS
jgi:hypothetical protein